MPNLQRREHFFSSQENVQDRRVGAVAVNTLKLASMSARTVADDIRPSSNDITALTTNKHSQLNNAPTHKHAHKPPIFPPFLSRVGSAILSVRPSQFQQTKTYHHVYSLTCRRCCVVRNPRHPCRLLTITQQ